MLMTQYVKSEKQAKSTAPVLYVQMRQTLRDRGGLPLTRLKGRVPLEAKARGAPWR